MSGPSVAILGGGVAGMSAAHELIERGFSVDIYERRMIAGGKARSVSVPNTGTDGRTDLPGEHGFRFFPQFYRHVTDTMSRIPYPGNANGVYGNLVGASREMLARSGKTPFVSLARFPRTIADLKLMIADMHDMGSGAMSGLTNDDIDFYCGRIWQLMTSCQLRVDQEYERIGWWQFVEADSRSKAYQDLLASGLSRTLVAADARTASTQSGGEVFLEILYGMARPFCTTDRVLCGPTNAVWIDPWLAYLRRRGVRYHFASRVKRFEFDGKRITGVTIERADDKGHKHEERIEADYYLSAVPVEVMAPLVSDAMRQADPVLDGLTALQKDVEWMNGIQFYLHEDVPIVAGHVTYIDSPWALTSISQHQFWAKVDLGQFGDGTVKGILSVDVSQWNEPGIANPVTRDGKTTYKTACECTPDEIVADVWEQIKRSVNVDGKELLRDDMRATWYIDGDIKCEPTARRDLEPLLVNKIRSWDLRPDASTAIPNLFLAADYVRTNTNLATMEAANEAARRAVNCIIDSSDVDASYCKVWELYQPWMLAPLRWYDQYRFNRGLTWNADHPWPVKLAHMIFVEFTRLLKHAQG